MGVRKQRNSGYGYLIRVSERARGVARRRDDRGLGVQDVKSLYALAPQANIVTVLMFVGGFVLLVFAKFVFHPQLERCFPNKKIVIPYELILVSFDVAKRAANRVENCDSFRRSRRRSFARTHSI